jgi:hypothetical protein
MTPSSQGFLEPIVVSALEDTMITHLSVMARLLFSDEESGSFVKTDDAAEISSSDLMSNGCADSRRITLYSRLSNASYNTTPSITVRHSRETITSSSSNTVNRTTQTHNPRSVETISVTSITKQRRMLSNTDIRFIRRPSMPAIIFLSRKAKHLTSEKPPSMPSIPKFRPLC